MDRPGCGGGLESMGGAAGREPAGIATTLRDAPLPSTQEECSAHADVLLSVPLRRRPACLWQEHYWHHCL